MPWRQSVLEQAHEHRWMFMLVPFAMMGDFFRSLDVTWKGLVVIATAVMVGAIGARFLGESLDDHSVVTATKLRVDTLYVDHIAFGMRLENVEDQHVQQAIERALDNSQQKRWIEGLFQEMYDLRLLACTSGGESLRSCMQRIEPNDMVNGGADQ